MIIRYAIAAAAVVSLAACAQTPTAPLADQAPTGPSFDSSNYTFGSGSRDDGHVFGSGSFAEDDGEGTTTTTMEGDSTGRGGFTLGSGS